MSSPLDPTTLALRAEAMEFLAEIFGAASPGKEVELLQGVCTGLGSLLSAEIVFVDYVLDDAPLRAHGVASWRRGRPGDEWEYSLFDNSRQLVYEEEPTFIPCRLAERFRIKNVSRSHNFTGIPLRGDNGKTIGHLAVYSSLEIAKNSFQFELMRLCAYRIEAEIALIRTRGHLSLVRGQADAKESSRQRALPQLNSVVAKSERLKEIATFCDEKALVSDIVDQATSALQLLSD